MKKGETQDTLVPSALSFRSSLTAPPPPHATKCHPGEEGAALHNAGDAPATFFQPTAAMIVKVFGDAASFPHCRLNGNVALWCVDTLVPLSESYSDLASALGVTETSGAIRLFETRCDPEDGRHPARESRRELSWEKTPTVLRLSPMQQIDAVFAPSASPPDTAAAAAAAAAAVSPEETPPQPCREERGGGEDGASDSSCGGNDGGGGGDGVGRPPRASVRRHSSHASGLSTVAPFEMPEEYAALTRGKPGEACRRTGLRLVAPSKALCRTFPDRDYVFVAEVDKVQTRGGGALVQRRSRVAVLKPHRVLLARTDGSIARCVSVRSIVGVVEGDAPASAGGGPLLRRRGEALDVLLRLREPPDLHVHFTRAYLEDTEHTAAAARQVFCATLRACLAANGVAPPWSAAQGRRLAQIGCFRSAGGGGGGGGGGGCGSVSSSMAGTPRTADRPHDLHTQANIGGGGRRSSASPVAPPPQLQTPSPRTTPLQPPPSPPPTVKKPDLASLVPAAADGGSCDRVGDGRQSRAPMVQAVCAASQTDVATPPHAATAATQTDCEAASPPPLPSQPPLSPPSPLPQETTGTQCAEVQVGAGSNSSDEDAAVPLAVYEEARREVLRVDAAARELQAELTTWRSGDMWGNLVAENKRLEAEAAAARYASGKRHQHPH